MNKVDYTNPLTIMSNSQTDSLSQSIIDMFEEDEFETLKKIRNDEPKIHFTLDRYIKMFCSYFQNNTDKIRRFINQIKCPVCFDTNLNHDIDEDSVSYDLNEFYEYYECNTCHIPFEVTFKCQEKTYNYDEHLLDEEYDS